MLTDSPFVKDIDDDSEAIKQVLLPDPTSKTVILQQNIEEKKTLNHGVHYGQVVAIVSADIHHTFASQNGPYSSAEGGRWLLLQFQVSVHVSGDFHNHTLPLL